MTVKFLGAGGASVTNFGPSANGKTFMGRAPAGATVALSDGSQTGSATAGSDGLWSFTFPNAPAVNASVVAKAEVSAAFVVQPASPTLNALTLSNATFTAGAAAGSLIGTISGQTAGSTLTFMPNDGRVAVGSSSLVVGMTAATAGTISGTVVETLAGATNSPRSTAVTLTVNAAQVGPPAGFSYLLGANGDRLLGSDGAYLYGVS